MNIHDIIAAVATFAGIASIPVSFVHGTDLGAACAAVGAVLAVVAIGRD